MIKRGTKNCVLIELEKLADDTYQFESGVKLLINTTYRPEHHQRIYGTCVAVPELLTKGDHVKFEDGDFRFADSIVPEVQIGDRVYFTYVSVHKGSLIEYEGKCYCNIAYSSILCVVRDIPKGCIIDIGKAMVYCKDNNIDFDAFMKQVIDNTVDFDFKVELAGGKKIIPIGGNILCEEYYGKGATSIEVNGTKVFGEISKSGLVTNIIKKPSQKQAVVKIVGSPLKEDTMEVAPGDLVTFPEKFGFKNNIEGTDYLFLKYWDIHGILEEV